MLSMTGTGDEEQTGGVVNAAKELSACTSLNMRSTHSEKRTYYH